MSGPLQGLKVVELSAMVDGVSVHSQIILELRSVKMSSDKRATNLLDGTAPFYRTSACAGGGYVAVWAIELQFYMLLISGLGHALADVLTRAFADRSRDEWTDVFDGVDACVTPC